MNKFSSWEEMLTEESPKLAELKSKKISKRDAAVLETMARPKTSLATARVLGALSKNPAVIKAVRQVANNEALRKSVRHDKVAGLFMRPSDVADNHTNLADMLESQLNGQPGKEFKKQASGINRSRLEGAAIGAIAVGGGEYLRRQFSEPTKQPPPQDPKGGFMHKMRHRLATAAHDNDQLARQYPVSTALAAATVGGATGAMIGSTHVQDLVKNIRRTK